MLIRARGPGWHQKQKKQGLTPLGLTGLDKEAAWSYAHADGWVYRHGSFCLVSHHTPVLGLLQWMPNSAHEAKRDHRMQLLTTPRRGMDKTPARQQMIQQMQTKHNRKIYRQRLTTVEPMQGLVKELFDLETCWRRGAANNRWLFAAMGVAVQVAQHRASRCGTSTWNVTEQVLGL
jgi:hypothetical protein